MVREISYGMNKINENLSNVSIISTTGSLRPTCIALKDGILKTETTEIMVSHKSITNRIFRKMIIKPAISLNFFSAKLAKKISF